MGQGSGAVAALRSTDRPRVAHGSGDGVAAEVVENPLDDLRILDARDHPQLPAAAFASLDVDGKDAPQALRPGQRALPAFAPVSCASLTPFHDGQARKAPGLRRGLCSVREKESYRLTDMLA